MKEHDFISPHSGSCMSGLRTGQKINRTKLKGPRTEWFIWGYTVNRDTIALTKNPKPDEVNKISQLYNCLSKKNTKPLAIIHNINHTIKIITKKQMLQ